jgi:hypothetical protein
MSESQSPCRPEDTSGCEYLTLAFSPSSGPVRARWRNNGLSADFLGDYVTTFLPSEEPVSTFESRQKAIKHAVSFVANELLENAMKYHQREGNVPIRMHLELSSDQVTVSVSNGASTSQAEKYLTFVARLREGNADEMLLAQQEESAMNSEASISSLGLLTMVSDYSARLDWRFEAHISQPDSVTVTTVAILPLKEFIGVSA